MHPQDLRQTAADFSAGDLSDQDAEEFLDMIKDDSSLGREVDFWNDMHTALKKHGRPAARVPGPGFNDVLKARLDREQQRVPATPIPNRTLTFPAWARLATAAIAASLFVVVGLDLLPRAMVPERVAYSAEGRDSALILTDDAPPLRTSAMHTVSRSNLTPVIAEQPLRQKAWVGMWFHPVTLQGFDQPTGLIVDRLVASGPAHSAGVNVGDVILGINGKAVCGAGCLHGEMNSTAPGEVMQLRYLDRKNNTIAVTRMVPDAFIE